IEAVHESHRWGASYAYWCVLLGVFVTALYTFRQIFMVFHGPERFAHAGESDHGSHEAGGAHGHAQEAAHGSDEHAHSDHGHTHHHKPHESPWVVTVPLILLAIPSVVIGFYTVAPVLFGHYFGSSIFVLERNNVVEEIAREFHGPASFAL